MSVSIIIPTHNRLWSLPKAIESCRHCEAVHQIIVVDDGSTDGTWEWLSSQPDLLCLRQENWGKAWAVNRALAIASGEYVRFLDSDDWLEPQANMRQWSIAKAEQADVVVSGYQIYNEQGEHIGQNPWQTCDDFIAQQLGECNNSHYSAYLFRRHFLAEIYHRPDYAFRDDRLFILEVALADPRIAVCPGYTLAHRHHSQSRLQAATGLKSVVTHWQHLNLYRKIMAMLEARDALSARRQKAIAKIMWPLAHWIAYTQLQEGVAIAKWVYELDPEFTPPESGLLGYCYRTFGFYPTELLLKARRILKGGLHLFRADNSTAIAS